MMSKKPGGPTVNAHVIDIAQKHFGTTRKAREALRKAIDAIPDAQLRRARGIHVFIIA